ncbi:5-methylcytosine-specific restriction protein B [Flavobacterium tiangeerense]|uniref:5-methylcytosine-specific restriction protein B n=1 Tax=Flavobacterium tiangeerense TaxID=459471 RepID=A0ABY3FN43_9FLAO|nr:AAA family ATPase [Flavobacterium tiangeerense]TWI03188.1 5-methylcytosine-specific restriction protein B [Flavobacterium tiangeerense]
MTIYKLGCIWGKGAPDFYEMIKGKNISLSHISDCNPKKNSVILITNGHTVKAITILLEDCQPVTNNPELKDSFDEYRISYNNETLYAKSKWIELKPEDYFLFKTQDGICQIHKQEIHQITKSLMSKYMLSENLNQQIELLKYKKQIILQGPPGTGKTKTAKDIAVEMLGLENVQDLNNNGQFKLIQFHPSYTYEDFVRGIVSVPNEDGEGVLFKTENKILAEFAEKANENFLLSQDNNKDALQDKWIDDNFEEFKAKIEEENVVISGTISIFKVDNDCFRYGKDWANSSRINFKDFKVIIKAVINERLNKDENQIPINISVHAHYRFTYYLALLRMFFEKQKYTLTNDKTILKNYVLIIDEINRANLPSVLGELIYALEYRNEPVESMYEYEGKREIVLPDNLYIIGTMNTADRSVGHIDYAIKRRFAFVDVLPTDQAIDDVVIDPVLHAKAKGLYHKVAALFNEDKSKTVYLQSDFKSKDVQLGHSYFLVETEKQLELKLEFEIKPLLNEYVKDGILSEEALLEIVNL